MRGQFLFFSFDVIVGLQYYSWALLQNLNKPSEVPRYGAVGCHLKPKTTGHEEQSSGFYFSPWNSSQKVVSKQLLLM